MASSESTMAAGSPQRLKTGKFKLLRKLTKLGRGLRFSRSKKRPPIEIRCSQAVALTETTTGRAQPEQPSPNIAAISNLTPVLPCEQHYVLHDDIFLQVLMHVGFPDVLAISQSSRFFYNLTTLREVWRNQVILLLLSGRSLVYDYSRPYSELTASDLRKIVLRTHFFDRNLGSPNPRACHINYPSPFDSIPHQILHHTNRFLVASIGNDVVIYDLVLKSLVKKFTQADSFIPYKFFLDPNHGHFSLASTKSDDRYVYNVLQTVLPPGNDPGEIFLDMVADVCLPVNWIGLDVTLHAAQKRLAVLCSNVIEQPGHARNLIVIYDWAKKVAMKLSVGLKLIASNTVTAARFSDNAETVHLTTELDGVWNHRSFSLSSFEDEAIDLPSVWTTPLRAPERINETIFKLADDELLTGNLSLATEHSLLTPEPAHGQSRQSLISVLKDTSSDANRWLITQCFTWGERPSTDRRCIFALNDPILNTCERPWSSFEPGYFCWADRVADRSGSPSESGETSKKSVMKIAKFPEPSSVHSPPNGLRPDIATLDIPHDILDSARLLYLNVSLAAIIIFTTNNEYHMYRYA